MADEKPWALFKEGKIGEGETVLYTALEILRQTALSLYPVTPKLAAAIWYQLGFDGKIEEVSNMPEQKGFSNAINPGRIVRRLGPVFLRIEDSEDLKI